MNHADRGVELGERRAHALEAAGDRLVARVDVALQLRVAVEAVLQLADLVERLVGLEQRAGALRERSLQRRERVHARVHLLHALFPRRPARVDGREVPAVLGRDLGAVARRRLGGDRCGGDGGGAQGAGDGDGHLHGSVALKSVDRKSFRARHLQGQPIERQTAEAWCRTAVLPRDGDAASVYGRRRSE